MKRYIIELQDPMLGNMCSGEAYDCRAQAIADVPAYRRLCAVAPECRVIVRPLTAQEFGILGISQGE